jgi:FkbM family methyltransferase
MGPTTVTSTNEGFEMWLDLNDKLISEAILASGTWEPHVTSVFKKELNKKTDAVLLDIGANMGWFTLMAAGLPQCAKVIALEPNWGNLQLLYKSLLRNDFCNVTVYPYAATEARSLVQLTSSSGDTGTGFTSPVINETNLDVTIVQGVKLDDLLSGEPRIDIIKMDIDGNEPCAIAGMLEVIEKHRPVIMAEFFPKGLKELAGIDPEEYLDVFTGLGYSYAVINMEGREVMCDSTAEVMQLWKSHGLDTKVGADIHLDFIARP